MTGEKQALQLHRSALEQGFLLCAAQEIDSVRVDARGYGRQGKRHWSRPVAEH
jgi:hypothetical protein